MRNVTKRALNLRFLLSLAVMAALSAASFLAAANIYLASGVSSNAVNLSGRQRMLTARIMAAFVGKRLARNDQAADKASARLKKATEELERMRDLFRQGAADLGIPAPDRGALRTLYFEPPDDLADKLDAFLENAKKAQGMNREELLKDDALLEAVLSADARIIPLLDRSVTLYAAINDAKAKDLLLIEFAATLASLCLLAAIGYFLFKPMRDAILRDREELAAMNARLEETASIDPLTGANNRLKFKEIYADMRARAARYEETVSCLMFDIDHFKKINDVCGHPTGDAVLKGLTSIVTANIRQTDRLFRWGGEEFLILLPHTDIEEAAAAAEKLRTAVEAHDFGCGLPVTVSVGAAQMRLCETEESLTMRTDKALYEAKRTGRNRVCLASDDAVECRIDEELLAAIK